MGLKNIAETLNQILDYYIYLEKIYVNDITYDYMISNQSMTFEFYILF